MRLSTLQFTTSAIVLSIVLIFGIARADVLYVSDWGTGSASTGAIDKVYPNGTVSTFVGSLNTPEGLAFDSHGNLFVALQQSEAIDKITPDGTITTFASGFSGIVAGLAIDASDNVYVSVENVGQIVKILPFGAKSVFASNIAGTGSPIFGLAFGAGGNLYATVANRSVVAQITPAGVVSQVGTVPSPTGLAYDGQGKLYVSSLSSSIYDIDSMGNVNVYTGATTANGEIGLALDHHGNLYAADYQQTSVTQIAPDGTHHQYAHGIAAPTFVAAVDPLGDFNRDGHVDGADVPVMLTALANLADYKTGHKLSDEDVLSIGDLNGDGKFTNADLQPMLDLLADGSDAASVVPEPSSMCLALLAAAACLASTKCRTKPLL